MPRDNEKIVTLKSRLKSVTKSRLSIDAEVLKLRTQERSLSEELETIKSNKDFLREQLESLKHQISQSTHQNSIIDVCMSSEKSKIETHVTILNRQLGGYQLLFDRERESYDALMKERRDREAELQELIRQKEKEAAKKDEQQEKEAAALEEECEAIESECAVLKKRNNAIMLKLRRKLLETENARREIMKQNASEKHE